MGFLSVLFPLKCLLSYTLLKQQLRQDYSWKPQQLQGSVQNNLGCGAWQKCWLVSPSEVMLPFLLPAVIQRSHHPYFPKHSS